MSTEASAPPPEVEDDSAADHEAASPSSAADFVPHDHLPAAGDEEAEDHYQRESLEAQHVFEAAVTAGKAGDEPRAVALYLKASKLAEDAREWYLAAVACHRVGNFLLTPHPPADIERALRMLRRAIASYEHCGMFNEAATLAYRIRMIRLKLGKYLKISPMRRLVMWVQWAVAGFGYRPLRTVLAALVVILSYGLIYWGVDGVVASRHPDQPATLLESIYFSGVTFTTIGYGDYIPALHAQWLAMSEGALGVFAIGFFVAMMVGRMHNS